MHSAPLVGPDNNSTGVLPGAMVRQQGARCATLSKEELARCTVAPKVCCATMTARIAALISFSSTPPWVLLFAVSTARAAVQAVDARVGQGAAQ